MTTIAHALLKAQEWAHRAAVAQRLMLTRPAEFDTPMNRADVADCYTMSHSYANGFAIGQRLHEAANDPVTPEVA